MNWIAAALIGGSLLLPPFLAGDFYINLASQILIAAIFALSLNLLVGFGGMTSLGHACGYYDQAHFIHDFQAFSGLTPRIYMTLATPHLNHVPLL